MMSNSVMQATNPSPRILRVAWVATMAGAVLRDAAVAVEGGKITAVGNPRDILQQYPEAPARTFDDAVLLPGLVNAHTHLELTGFDRRELPGDGFIGWVLELRRRAMEVKDFPAFVAQSVSDGINQCLRFGVTSVGDVALNCNIVRRVLNGCPLKGVSFGEVLGMAGRAAQFSDRFAAAIDRAFEREGMRIGLEPHAPYSLEMNGYRRCAEYAREQAMPICTHLAENAEEAIFLSQHQGMFRKLWEDLGWSDSVEKFEGGPIRFAREVGLLDLPTVLAHVNYVDDEEMGLLSGKPPSVVYCPRTHAYFRHGPHRFREMMARGINVAVGTDSALSAGDLNLLEDLRLLHRIAPDIDVEMIWRMGTINGAKALGMEKEVGTIEIGKSADFVMFPAMGEEPLKEVLEGNARAMGVWVNGSKI